MMDLETIILEAATADVMPPPFTVNTALRNAGVADLRVRELMDRQLHVFDSRGPERAVTLLSIFAERMI